MNFLAKAKDGELDFGSDFNKRRFYFFLKEKEGKDFEVKEKKRKRSLNQNDFYWLYLQLIERETGNNSTDLHELFKRKFLLPQFLTVLNQTIKIPRSTSGLSKMEFSEYMEKICAETEIPIPDSEAYKIWRDSAPNVGEEY